MIGKVNDMNVSKEFIRCLEIEHDIMLLENQIKNLTQERNKLVKELECLKGQAKVDNNPTEREGVNNYDIKKIIKSN